MCITEAIPVGIIIIEVIKLPSHSAGAAGKNVKKNSHKSSYVELNGWLVTLPSSIPTIVYNL